MTTANEPSVAELVVKLKDRLRADTQFGGNKDYPIANSELRQIVRALEGLERRCAEMEKALRAAANHTTLAAGQCHCCWAMPEQPHDEGCWVDAALKLLPPERANEGTKP